MEVYSLLKPKSLTALLAFLLFFLMASAYPADDSQEGSKKLTFEQAYLRGKPRLFQPFPMNQGWIDDHHYLVLERDEKAKTQKMFKINARTGKKALFLDYAEIQKALPTGFGAAQHIQNTKDYTGLLYSRKGDLYYFSVKGREFKRLTATLQNENNPRFSPDGKFLAYTRGRNLYTLEIESGLEYQLTQDGSDTVYNGWASWVYYEEILGRRTRYSAFWWSPDSLRISFLRFNDSPVPTFPLFRSGGAHGELEIERYPKAGDPNPYVKLGVCSATGGKVVWADVKERADHYVAFPFWYSDSSKLTFQWMNRDQNTIKLYGMDLKAGEKTEILQERQPTWVEFYQDLHFFSNGKDILLRSDVDGWSHLYIYDLERNLKKRLTKGNWTVSNIALVDENRQKVFFHARKEKSTETHLYSVKLDGSGLKRLTQQPGSHRASVSPGGSFFIDSYSSIDTPSRQDILRTDGTFIRTTADSRTQVLEEYKLGKKELLTVTTEDGVNLPAYWILPPFFDENAIYPVLFTIYGGPGSSSVSNSYPYLPLLFLAQEGIIVFSLDHRGSGHFGKNGMALMHRKLGKWEMNDLTEGVKWLQKKPFIDKSRIGITGGSYGGYTTCMALTYGADYFTHGYARSSVTDWHLYDSVYTERYMDRPVDNKEGYTFGSVMTHAKKLKGVLFLSHGDMDDNVHMQNTIQLIDKLIDLGKKFFFIPYPNQRHGYRGSKRQHSDRHFIDFWFEHFLNR
jgi:dipeptidyl-peptidase-4